MKKKKKKKKKNRKRKIEHRSIHRYTETFFKTKKRLIYYQTTPLIVFKSLFLYYIFQIF